MIVVLFAAAPAIERGGVGDPKPQRDLFACRVRRTGSAVLSGIRDAWRSAGLTLRQRVLRPHQRLSGQFGARREACAFDRGFVRIIDLVSQLASRVGRR